MAIVNYPQDFLKAVMDLVAADALTLAGGKIRLFTVGPTFAPGVTWAEFTEAAFDGYAASAAVTWGAAYQDAAGNGVVAGASHQFTMSGITTPETVIGAALVVDGTPKVLLAYVTFDNPIPMSQIGDAIIVVPIVGLPGPVDFLVAGP